MDVQKIPFNEFLGIEISDKPEYLFKIKKNPRFCNHLGALHTGVMVALAETTSGECLLRSLSEYTDKTTPMLRNASIKVISPGESDVFSKAGIPFEETERLLFELDEKGRTMIVIQVQLFNEKNKIVVSADFEWFILLQ